jgi:hypothetical protein
MILPTDRPEYDTPSYQFVKRDALIEPVTPLPYISAVQHQVGDVNNERDHAVERCSAQERDKVAADREQDERDVDVKDKSGGTSDDCEEGDDG